METVKELLRTEADGTLSFGNYTLGSKTKLDGFEFQGDLYKVKTFRELTKLERNEMFVYESVPGTTVEHFNATGDLVSFEVFGDGDAQFTIGLEDDSTYEVFLNEVSVGTMTTNLSGKLSVSADLSDGSGVKVKIVKR